MLALIVAKVLEISKKTLSEGKKCELSDIYLNEKLEI